MNLKERLIKIAEGAGIDPSNLNLRGIDDFLVRHKYHGNIKIDMDFSTEMGKITNIILYCNPTLMGVECPNNECFYQFYETHS